MKDKEGYVFELQFHTTDSLKVKEINHKLYEERRLDDTTDARKKELDKEMIKNTKSIVIPKNISEIHNL